MTTANPEKPDKQQCRAALIIRGEHFFCDNQHPHPGWAHGSRRAEAIWDGPATQAYA